MFSKTKSYLHRIAQRKYRTVVIVFTFKSVNGCSITFKVYTEDTNLTSSAPIVWYSVANLQIRYPYLTINTKYL